MTTIETAATAGRSHRAAAVLIDPPVVTVPAAPSPHGAVTLTPAAPPVGAADVTPAAAVTTPVVAAGAPSSTTSIVEKEDEPAPESRAA